MLPQPIEQAIQATASIAYTEITNLAQDLALPEEEYSLAQILEVYDEHICPLCAWLNGKIIKRGTPEWEKYRLPSHINCRRTFAYIPADADEQPDFEEPPPSLLQKHGHFHTDPLKYEELRIPAFADRRQFIFRRIKDPETGKWRSILQWLAPREGGDAERYLIGAELIRPGSRLANILASLPRRRPNKALQELAEQLDAVVDGLGLGRPLHRRVRFNAQVPGGYKGGVVLSKREIRIDKQTTQLLRELVAGTPPSVAHLEAVEILLHELVQSRSPLLHDTARLPRGRRALLARDPRYVIARQAEEGLVELWARQLLKNLSEHPINEENEADYFSGYNAILQGWRHIQIQAGLQASDMVAWFSEPDHQERTHLLNRYIRQAITRRFDSFDPDEEQQRELEQLLSSMESPDRLSPLWRMTIPDWAIDAEGLAWMMMADPPSITQITAQTANEMLRQLRRFLGGV